MQCKNLKRFEVMSVQDMRIMNHFASIQFDAIRGHGLVFIQFLSARVIHYVNILSCLGKLGLTCRKVSSYSRDLSEENHNMLAQARYFEPQRFLLSHQLYAYMPRIVRQASLPLNLHSLVRLFGIVSISASPVSSYIWLYSSSVMHLASLPVHFEVTTYEKQKRVWKKLVCCVQAIHLAGRFYRAFSLSRRHFGSDIWP